MTTFFKVFFISFLFVGIPTNNRVERMIQKEVKAVFEIENFSKEAIVVSEDFNVETPVKVDGTNYFTIKDQEEVLGYYYLGQGFGKTDYFDFIVIFNKELIVSKVKILVYREDHGGEIGSKRWLKQFIGKPSEDELKYEDVVAISGATLSARSMTVEINKSMQTIAILKEHNQI